MSSKKLVRQLFSEPVSMAFMKEQPSFLENGAFLDLFICGRDESRVLQYLCEIVIWLIVFKYILPGDRNLFTTTHCQENAGNEKSFDNRIMIIFICWAQD